MRTLNGGDPEGRFGTGCRSVAQEGVGRLFSEKPGGATVACLPYEAALTGISEGVVAAYWNT